MAKSNLFNIAVSPHISAQQAAAALAATPAAAPATLAAPSATPAVAGPTAVGVITAQQSVITFAGAPTAVIIVWKVLSVAFPILASSKLIPIGLSLLVGILIWWQSATGTTKKEKFFGFVFAMINSFAIAAATLGIDTAVTPGSGASAPPPNP